MTTLANRLRGLLRGPGQAPEAAANVAEFHTHHYLRHNARRLEHLASFGIPVAGASVLEVGAGIGDHTHYYLDRGCRVTITEARRENLQILMQRYPGHDVQFMDMEQPYAIEGAPFDVVHCYGLLYHLKNPLEALDYLGQNCRRLLLLETCVSFGVDSLLVRENQADPTQAYSGIGSRLSRNDIFDRLRGLFEFVYVPLTQPNHEEFPLDWTAPEQHPAKMLSRAVFIASREQLDNPLLVTSLPDRQTRHP
jgi:hypothetical protein